MAQDHALELIGTILLFIFGVTMICQGHAIFHGKYGYKHTEREQKKSADIRKELEQMLKDK
jgi:GH24 family phage-related lysozyme (muramidase)|tara:strand:- start:373 stop:555 length:183 start_codon:yes stop_codon:yes gene_type:complete